MNNVNKRETIDPIFTINEEESLENREQTDPKTHKNPQTNSFASLNQMFDNTSSLITEEQEVETIASSIDELDEQDNQLIDILQKVKQKEIDNANGIEITEEEIETLLQTPAQTSKLITTLFYRQEETIKQIHDKINIPRIQANYIEPYMEESDEDSDDTLSFQSDSSEASTLIGDADSSEEVEQIVQDVLEDIVQNIEIENNTDRGITPTTFVQQNTPIDPSHTQKSSAEKPKKHYPTGIVKIKDLGDEEYDEDSDDTLSIQSDTSEASTVIEISNSSKEVNQRQQDLLEDSHQNIKAEIKQVLTEIFTTKTTEITQAQRQKLIQNKQLTTQTIEEYLEENPDLSLFQVPYQQLQLSPEIKHLLLSNYSYVKQFKTDPFIINEYISNNLHLIQQFVQDPEGDIFLAHPNPPITKFFLSDTLFKIKSFFARLRVNVYKNICYYFTFIDKNRLSFLIPKDTLYFSYFAKTLEQKYAKNKIETHLQNELLALKQDFKLFDIFRTRFDLLQMAMENNQTTFLTQYYQYLSEKKLKMTKNKEEEIALMNTIKEKVTDQTILKHIEYTYSKLFKSIKNDLGQTACEIARSKRKKSTLLNKKY